MNESDVVDFVEGVPCEESEILAAVEAFHKSATPQARRQWIHTYLGAEAHQKSLELSASRRRRGSRFKLFP